MKLIDSLKWDGIAGQIIKIGKFIHYNKVYSLFCWDSDGVI